MEFKGTKKWILDNEGYLKDENFDIVAEFSINNEKDLANAKLASKAPEMIEMLKNISQILEEVWDEEDGDNIIFDKIDAEKLDKLIKEAN